MRTLSRCACALGLAVVLAGRAEATPEDLKRQIDVQRASVADLERLDDRRTVADEIALLRTWLDEAWGRYSKKDYDQVREVLDRCVAQAELIREKTASAKIVAQAVEREGALQASRDRAERTRQALQVAIVKKKAMEMNAK